MDIPLIITVMLLSTLFLGLLMFGIAYKKAHRDVISHQTKALSSTACLERENKPEDNG